MAGEGGIVDRLVVAVEYAYDTVVPDAIEADFSGLIGLAGTLAAAMVGLAVGAAHAGDAAHDMGIRMGLSAEEVTAWSYAADRAGTSTEVLSRGLVTLQRNLGAARAGSGPAAEAFKKLKIDPKKFENSSDALFKVADALQSVEDEGDRATLQLALLGEAGPRLSEFLSQGGEGIDELLAQAERIGVVISDADAELSGDFLDAVDDLGEIAASTGRKIGFAVLPALTRVAKGVRDWYLANDDIIGQQIDRVADGIGYALGMLETPVGKAAAGALALASAWGAAGAAKALYEAAKASSPLVAALGSQAGNAIAVAKAAGPLALAIAAAGLAIDDFAVAAEGGDSVLLDLGEAMGARGETQQAAAGLIKLLSAGTDAAWAFAGALEVGIGDAIDAIAAKLPSLEPLLAPLRELFDLSAADVIGGAAKQFERSAAGLELGTRYLRGDAGVQFSEGRDWTDVLGALARFTPDGIARSLASPTVQVQVNGSNPSEVARIAGEAARTEVERQTLEALSAVGMPP